MSKLFLYYSHSGNGDVVAAYLQGRGFESRKVQRQKKLPKALFPLMMKGGFLAAAKHKDKLRDFDTNLEGYEEIVIGSPIWNGRFASPTNTLLSKVDLSNKKVAFVFYAGGGEAPKAEKRVAKEYPSASCVVLKEPKKNPEELEKLSAIL